MQQTNNKDFLSKQRKEIIAKYRNGPSKNNDDDWENPQYSIYAITDYYGFLHDGGISDEFLMKETRIKKLDCKREAKWRKLIENNRNHKTSKVSYASYNENPFSFIAVKMNDSLFREEFTKRIYKGIPQQFKASIWHVFLEINRMKNKKSKIYDMMLQRAMEKSPDVHQIDLDVNRTFRNTIYFRERYNDRQKALLHVLSAYSMYNTEIGYCQGMSEIGGLLLMYLVEEEDVFWGLCQLMASPRWCMHGMFVPGFPRLLTFFAHLNVILQKLLPKIAKHFEKLELMSSSYALKWFMQCFLDRVPFTLFLRVWDIYLLEGEKLLIAMAYNILKLHKKRIIKMDHCSILQFLQSELRKDFLYDDDFVVESLKACIEELRKHKLSVPPPAQSHELPSRPFGSEVDLQTSLQSSIKERQTVQTNPDSVLRHSIKKRNSVKRRPPARVPSSPIQKNAHIKSISREHSHKAEEIDPGIPMQVRYRISHKPSQIKKPISLHSPDEVKDRSDSLKIELSSKTQDRNFVKSVPDLTNKNADILELPNNTHKRLLPKPTSQESNHLPNSADINSNTKSKTVPTFQQSIPKIVKSRPLSSSPETEL